MRPAWAIAARDLRGLLHTLTGWLVLAGFQLLSGVFFLTLVDNYVARASDGMFDPFAAVHLSVAEHLLAPFFGNVAILLLVVAPAVTMRSFAEEVRGHTLDLLLTAPVGPGEVALGKLLGSFAFLVLLLVSTAWMPLWLTAYGPLDAGAVVGGYLSLALLGAALCGVGTLASVLTDSPLVALVLSFAVSLVLWIVGWLDPDPTSLISQLSLAVHVRDLSRGAVRLSDVAFFVLLTVWCWAAIRARVDAWRYL